MASFTEMARRKVLGVPVLYLAGGAVVILAVVAWRIKPAPTADTPPVDNGGTTDPTLPDYTGLATNGTVTVVQQPVNTQADPVIATNETWVRDGATWLMKTKGVAGSAAAAALTKYVNGQEQSFQERGWTDDVINEKGQPPDHIAEGGGVQAKPAQKQFPAPPGTHTISGPNDNTFRAIANLYYGHSAAEDINLIQGANPTFGGTLGPFAVGTKIVVPAFHDPKYVTTGKKNLVWRDAARIYAPGITADQLRVMNDTNKWAQSGYVPASSRLRVA